MFKNNKFLIVILLTILHGFTFKIQSNEFTVKKAVVYLNKALNTNDLKMILVAINEINTKASDAVKNHLSVQTFLNLASEKINRLSQSADQDDSGVASGDIQNVPMTPLSQKTDQLSNDSNDGDGISQGSDQSASSSQQDQGFVSGVPTPMPTTPVITPTPIINPAPVIPMPGPVIAPTKIKEPMSKPIDQVTPTSEEIVPAMPENQDSFPPVPQVPTPAPTFNETIGKFNKPQSETVSTGNTPPPAPIIGGSSSHGTTPPPPPLPGIIEIITRSKDLAHVLPKDKKETKQDLIKQIDPKKFDVSQITAFKFKSFVEQYDLNTSKDNLKLKIDDKNIDTLAKDIAQVIDQLQKDKKCFLNGKPMPIKTAFVNTDLIKLLTNIFDTFTKYDSLATKNLIVSYDNKNFEEQFLLFYDAHKDTFNEINALSKNYLKAIALFLDINTKLQEIDISLKSLKKNDNNDSIVVSNAKIFNQCIDDYETARILLLKECNIENLEKNEIKLFNDLQSAIRDFKSMIDTASDINLLIAKEKVDSGEMLTAIKELTLLVDGYNNAAQQFVDNNYEPLSIPPLCLLTMKEIRQLKNNAIATNTLNALNNKYNHNQMSGESFKGMNVINISTKKPIRCILADQNEIQSQDLKRPFFPNEINQAYYGILTEDKKTPKKFDDGSYKIALIIPQVFNPLTDLELLKNLSFYKLKGLDNAKNQGGTTTIFLTNNQQCLTVDPASLKREELTLLALRLSLPANSDIETIIKQQQDLQSQGVSDLYNENNKVAYVIYSFTSEADSKAAIEYQNAVNNIKKEDFKTDIEYEDAVNNIKKPEFKAAIEYQNAINNIHKAPQESLNHIIERTLRPQ